MGEYGLENPEFLGGAWRYSSGELSMINGWLAQTMAKEGVMSIRKLLFVIKEQMNGRLFLEDIEQIARIESYPYTLVALPRHTIPNDFDIEGDLPYAVWVLEFDQSQATAMDIVSGVVMGKIPSSPEERELVYTENVRRLKDAGLAEPSEGAVNTFSLS